jgi:hypothetical protein
MAVARVKHENTGFTRQLGRLRIDACPGALTNGTSQFLHICITNASQRTKTVAPTLSRQPRCAVGAITATLSWKNASREMRMPLFVSQYVQLLLQCPANLGRKTNAEVLIARFALCAGQTYDRALTGCRTRAQVESKILVASMLLVVAKGVIPFSG